MLSEKGLPPYLFLLLLVISLFSPSLLAGSDRKGDEPYHDITIKESADPLDKDGVHDADDGRSHHKGVPGKILPLFWGLPFVGILLSIALMPVTVPHFWHKNYGKVSLFWALTFSIPYIIKFKEAGLYDICHIFLVDYFPFIILLWALFTISGGILLKGNLPGRPHINTLMLAIGTLLASWIGTTGASMVMIRPLIRANKWRRSKIHIVIFFIFLVSNIGGSLTPLGDPPLFLGFLHGVPFFWTIINLFIPMLFTAGILLILFFVIDFYLYIKNCEKPPITEEKGMEGIALKGIHNFLFLAGVIGAILMSGLWRPGISLTILDIDIPLQNLIREGIIIIMGLFSLATTKKEIRKMNEFTWFPIVEVAKLFAGIFATMTPVLAILYSGAEGGMRGLIALLEKPFHYFWITGILSSFLDNAPTYLTFYSMALGRFGIQESIVAKVLSGGEHLFPDFLLAISLGAVFMGANTYIGNAPNFMVKSIAEERGIKMPSFFGYMVWSIGILIPLFILVTIVFIQ